MPDCESSVTIDAAPEAVWRLLSGVSSWPQWLPTVTRVDPLDQPDVRVGGRFTVHQPRLRAATWTVSHVDAPRSFTWTAGSPGLRMVAEHIVTSEGSRRSRVVLRFRFGGLLGALVGRLYHALVQDYVAQEAAALKRRAEAASADSTGGA